MDSFIRGKGGFKRRLDFTLREMRLALGAASAQNDVELREISDMNLCSQQNRQPLLEARTADFETFSHRETPIELRRLSEKSLIDQTTKGF